jgi:hypothetical protein
MNTDTLFFDVMNEVYREKLITGGTWQVKSNADIDTHIEEQRQQLDSEMEEDTVPNIELLCRKEALQNGRKHLTTNI